MIERIGTPVVFEEIGVAGLFAVTDGEFAVEFRGFSLKIVVLGNFLDRQPALGSKRYSVRSVI